MSDAGWLKGKRQISYTTISVRRRSHLLIQIYIPRSNAYETFRISEFAAMVSGNPLSFTDFSFFGSLPRFPPTSAAPSRPL